MTVSTGRAMTLVASSRPPSPTSSSSTSEEWRWKAWNAAAVVISKKVIGAPSFTASQWARLARNDSSAIGVPPNLIRSAKRTRCGET